jgi:hypothetical protein
MIENHGEPCKFKGHLPMLSVLQNALYKALAHSVALFKEITGYSYSFIGQVECITISPLVKNKVGRLTSSIFCFIWLPAWMFVTRNIQSIFICLTVTAITRLHSLIKDYCVLYKCSSEFMRTISHLTFLIHSWHFDRFIPDTTYTTRFFKIYTKRLDGE